MSEIHKYKIYLIKDGSIHILPINKAAFLINHDKFDFEFLLKYGWCFYGTEISDIRGYIMWDELKFTKEEILNKLILYPNGILGSPSKEFILKFKSYIRNEKIDSII